MKKSQLRNIIRESIKELMTEQTTMPPAGTLGIRTCKCTNAQNMSCDNWYANGNGVPQNSPYQLDNKYYYGSWMKGNTVDGNAPQAGDIININGVPHLIDMVNDGTAGTGAGNTYPVMSSCPGCNGYALANSSGATINYGSWTTGNLPSGCNQTPPCTTYGCTDPTAMNYDSTILPNCDQGCVYQSDFGCTDSTASNYDPAAIYDDGSCITAAGGCDPSAWSNHANWTSTFTNTVNNANNTCNFLNIKIAQFTSQIPNVGPVWANQLQCKLDLANQLHTQNNC